MKGNIIITGFQGFIGLYTTAKLINEDYVVYGVDKDKIDRFKMRLLESLLNDTSRFNTHLKPHYEFDLTQYSLKDLELINLEQTNKKTIEMVIHYASPVGVKLIQDQPYQTLKDALTINMMIDDYCTKYKIPLIFSSSSEVYGNNDNEMSVDSDFNIKQGRRGTYAAQKATSELLFNHNKAYSSANVRFFNIVGYGQSTEGMVMNTFINNIFKGIPLRIFENSERSFCAVEDAVEMVYEVVQNIFFHAGISKLKSTYNIGNPNNNIRIKDLAKLVITKYNELVKNNKYFEQDLLDLATKPSYIQSRHMGKTGLKFNKYKPLDDIIEDYLIKYQEYN